MIEEVRELNISNDRLVVVNQASQLDLIQIR